MSKIVISNKKAHFNYEFIEKYETGISLKGSEVKSIVLSQASLDEAFVIIKREEAYILNMYVAPFKQGNIASDQSTRTRKLLLHKNEIVKIDNYVKKNKTAIVPVDVHLSHGKIKLTIAIAKSKNKSDKRETIKKRDDQRVIKQYI